MSGYIAFDLDALNVARDVGVAAGIPEERVTHGLLRMWAWCFRERTESVRGIQVQGFFGMDAAPALVAFGFLEPTGETYRVRGAERYLRVSEQRRNAGKARSSSAGRSAGRFTSGAPAADQRTTSGPPAENQPLHRTPSTEHRTPKEAAAAATAPAELHANLEPPKASPEAWGAEDFWRWAQCKRREAQLAVERWPHPSKLSTWWSSARGIAEPEALQEAFYRFGDDRYWQKQVPPLPFAGFMAQFEKYLPRGGVA